MVTYYVGGHEAIFQSDGTSEIKRYIRDIAIHTIKSTGSDSLHYVFNDHLGSGSVITDKNGSIVETASFDAFGKRRNATNWQGYSNPFSQLTNLTALLNITQKGYTGHIQVDHAAVIHMGGRIYDPELGRFMQADPIVQDPRDAQSLNRYSYVYNNPLSYTDPTGYAPECGVKGKAPCPATVEQEKADAAKAAQANGNSNNKEVNQSNSSADLQNTAKAANGQRPTPEQMREIRRLKARADYGGRDLQKFWKAVGAELWNNAGGYAKQIFNGAVNNLLDNAPQAAADVSGYTTAVEISDAVKAGDGQALAIAVVLGVARPLKIAERLDDVAKNVDISRAKYGDAADHIADAQKAGHPDVLTIARDGADANRKASIGGLPKIPGKQLDEYPPAMFAEGGAGASVRAISPKNNMGAGACIGNACRSLANGEKVRIRVVD